MPVGCWDGIHQQLLEGLILARFEYRMHRGGGLEVLRLGLRWLIDHVLLIDHVILPISFATIVIISMSDTGERRVALHSLLICFLSSEFPK